MSYMQENKNVYQFGGQLGDDNAHKQVLFAPYNWMESHKNQVIELNIRNDDKLSKAVTERYVKYQERLQKEEDAAAPRLDQSVVLQRL